MGIQRILFQQREMSTDEENRLLALHSRVRKAATSISQLLETHPGDIQDEILQQVRIERSLRSLACAERLQLEAEKQAESEATFVVPRPEPMDILGYTDESIRLSKSRLLRRREVEQITGLSCSTIYRKMADGTFPAAVRLAKQTVAWREGDIAAWLDSLGDVKRRAAGGE